MTVVDDIYTKTLLHFDGTQNSTSFVDETGRIWTANGNAKIDTASKVFGTGSGLFDGTGDYIDTPDSSDFDVASGDFTVDWRFLLSSTGSVRYIWGQTTATNDSLSIGAGIWNDNKLFVTIGTAPGSSVNTYGSTVLSAGVWYHAAYVRSGGSLKTYINGNVDISTSISGVNNSPGKFSIGKLGETSNASIYPYFYGRIDEFRFTKGFARWTSNFTPPSQAYFTFDPTLYPLQKIIMF